MYSTLFRTFAKVVGKNYKNFSKSLVRFGKQNASKEHVLKANLAGRASKMTGSSARPFVRPRDRIRSLGRNSKKGGKTLGKTNVKTTSFKNKYFTRRGVRNAVGNIAYDSGRLMQNPVKFLKTDIKNMRYGVKEIKGTMHIKKRGKLGTAANAAFSPLGFGASAALGAKGGLGKKSKSGGSEYMAWRMAPQLATAKLTYDMWKGLRKSRVI